MQLVRVNPPRVKSAFIDAVKASFPISRMCRVLGVCQRGFSAGRKVRLVSTAAGNGPFGAYLLGLRAVKRHLRLPAMHWDLVDAGHADGIARRADARGPLDHASEAALQAHEGQRTYLGPGPRGGRRHGGRPGKGMRNRRPQPNWSCTKSSDQRAFARASTRIGARVPMALRRARRLRTVRPSSRYTR